MKLYLEIDIRPHLHLRKWKATGTSTKKVMKKFYELFAQPSYMPVCRFTIGFLGQDRGQRSLSAKLRNFLNFCTLVVFKRKK